MNINRIAENRWNQNCFILSGFDAGCIVIDPGCGAEAICSELDYLKVPVVAILATHGHFDHIASVARLQGAYDNPPFLIHEADAPTLHSANAFCLAFKEKAIQVPVPSRFLADHEVLDFLGIRLGVMHTPGHTPGGCIFFSERAVFSGDLLIQPQQALERLPGFDAKALAESRQKVFTRFHGHIVNYPGHGRERTLEETQAFLATRGTNETHDKN